MASPVFRTYSLVPRGGPGLTCDEDGLALGPITLAKKAGDDAGNRHYRLLPLDDMVKALRLAYGTMPDAIIERRCRGLARVAQLLGVGADALARIYAVLIGFPEIVPEGMAKLTAAASLRKYNPDWEDEPRVPAGNPGGGQWTNDADGSGGNDEQSGSPIDVAYQGAYHDQVVAQLAEHWRAQGNKVLTSVDLIARNGATARADIIAVEAPGEPPVLVEVKTGNDPQYTPGQQVVYPMAQIGDHVYSPNTKIGELGFSPGQWLPPMEFVTIYKQDENSPYSVIVHPNPIVP
jgi:hypothetical protein